MSGLITPSLGEMERFAAEMEREGVDLPLLIGGATTSARHTALRIAPERSNGPVVHVSDASRASETVRSLLGAESVEFAAGVRRAQEEERRGGGRGRTALLDLAAARARAPGYPPASDVVPAFLGARTIPRLPIGELIPYVDWTPFFHAWQFRGAFPGVIEKGPGAEAAAELFGNARRRLDELAEDERFAASAVYGFFPAGREGDDLLVWRGPAAGDSAPSPVRIPTLRQQEARGGARLAAADFVAEASGPDAPGPDTVGMFCVTAGTAFGDGAAEAERGGDDYEALLLRSLGDRVAEAAAEHLHEQARRDLGYGVGEDLNPSELLRGKYRGIRPAPGYPATPDLGILREIFDLLDAETALGVRLTESFAIAPAASVAGLYFGSAESRYFSVGRIGRDQLEDYAARRGIPVEEAERLLIRVLGP